MANLTPNKKNLRERADYGVRVARPGFDAGTCAQNQLIFNSGWPILQVVDVIDLDDINNNYVLYRYTVTIWRTDMVHGITTKSEETSLLDYVPSGYESTSQSQYTPTDNNIMVNKKYIQRDAPGTVTSYYYPSTTVREGDFIIETEKSCISVNRARKTHGLGYVPLFIESKNVSNLPGYVLLFSVDIATDVDYPYTEASLPMLTAPKDYGIKSSSIFGKRVPGLCTGMFSKLVQAVKTQATSKGTDEIRTVWSPVSSANEAKDGILLPYEFCSFVSDSSTDTGIDGGAYYGVGSPTFLQRTQSGDSISTAWAVSSEPYFSDVTTKNSIVVLRSPMVSPEYETRTI